MTEISSKLETLTNNMNKIGDFQDREFKSRILSVVTLIGKISQFNSEIMENDDQRNLKLVALENLKSTATELLGQVNITISDITSKNPNPDYKAYQTQISDFKLLLEYQSVLVKGLDKNMQPIGGIVVGQISKLEISPTPDKARAMTHNHPSGETFSLKDISTFTIDEKLDILEIVGNNGSLYLIEKGEDYDFVAVRKRWIKATDDYNNCDQSNKRKIEISEEFLNDSRKFGLNYKIFRRE